MPMRADETSERRDPDDCPSDLQRILAILADLDLRHAIQRDELESWSGPRPVKTCLLADLDRCHRSNRERLAACLDRLRPAAEDAGSALTTAATRL